MRYQVPQFIEIEDKIFGPLTLKQFIYLAGGAGLSYLVYAATNAYLPIFIIIILVVPVAGFAVALAFYKINNKPFIDVVESAVKYYIGSKLYIWKKDGRQAVSKEGTQQQNLLTLPKLADSKLKDLAWNLDISKNRLDIANSTIFGIQQSQKSNIGVMPTEPITRSADSIRNK